MFVSDRGGPGGAAPLGNVPVRGTVRSKVLAWDSDSAVGRVRPQLGGFPGQAHTSLPTGPLKKVGEVGTIGITFLLRHCGCPWGSYIGCVVGRLPLSAIHLIYRELTG